MQIKYFRVSPKEGPSSRPKSGLHVFHAMNKVDTPNTPQDSPEPMLARQRLYTTLEFAFYWANLSLFTALDNDGAIMAGHTVVTTNGHVKSKAHYIN